MLIFIYLVIGAALGWYEVKQSRKEGLENDEGMIIVFLVFLLLWLPIYVWQWFKKEMKKD